MNYFKLSALHKKWFIIHQVGLLIALLLMFILALKITHISLPSNEAKLSASGGFVVIAVVLIFALFNRISLLFKVKSVGFFIFWALFMMMDYIIDPLKWAFGLMMIPLIIDDLILRPIWLNIWYNNYDN